MRFTLYLIIFCAALMHANAYGMTTAADKKLLLDKEIKNLQATYAAWQSNDAEFRDMRAQGRSSETDVREFAGFVAGLKRQVIEGCEAVRQRGGDASQHGVDCVKLTREPASATSADVTIPKREATGEEQKKALKQELETVFAGFDELLLKEQETLKEQEIARQSNGSRGGAGSGTAEGSEAAAEGEAAAAGDEAAATGEEAAAAGDKAADQASKDGPMQGRAEPGAGPGMQKQGDMPEFEKGDVGSGSDDDVVARQLREAAEAETDPVLKAKLWEEYRKYKNSTR